MKRNASITKGKAEPEEADVEVTEGPHKGKRLFYGSPWGTLIIDDKGITTREDPE